MQPKVYLSLSQETPPSLTALCYVEVDNDLYGWYLFAQEHDMSPGFFMIENFYTARTPVLYRSVEDDAYAAWTVDYPLRKNAIRCPVHDGLVHELERIQSAFVDDWLFFENDPDNAAEFAAYQRRKLPLQVANIRIKKLSRFRKTGPRWTHCTPGTDINVPEFLSKHWNLDWLMSPQAVSVAESTSSSR